MKKMHTKRFILLSLMGFVAPPLYAETDTAKQPDIDSITKKWKCKYCPDLSEEQWEGYLDIGLGYVTNDSYKFGEYNGLEEEGAYLNGDVEALYRNDEGHYWDIRGTNIGLDNADFGVRGGKQGQYKLQLEIDQIKRHQLDTSRTPYSGDANLTLPPGWVNAGSTAGFTTLANDLKAVNFSTTRRQIVLGGEYHATQRWSYGVEFNRRTKEGHLPTSFGFGFTGAAVLPKPIDYVTDNVEVNAKYRYANFNGKLAFIHSTFKNDIDAFRWENAYNAPAGANEGQAGTAPDNTKQQLLFMGNYLGIDNVQFTGMLSIAQMTQDEAYLPFTVNGSFISPALPRNSLDGKVLVVNTNLAAHWQYSDQQDWHFVYEHHDQDNSTERATYTYVNADNSVTGTPRANFPYSFRQQKLKAYTDYRTENKMKLSGGLQYLTTDRDYQSVEQTEEGSLWGKLKHRISNGLEYSVKAEYSDRSIDNYDVVNELTPAENPLMRKFNMADRTGQKLVFNLGYTATESLFLNFSSELAQYDYDASEIGLTDSDEFSIGLDMHYSLDEDLGFSAFIQNTDIQSRQAGFSTASWTADTDDNILTIGLGASYQVIEETLKIGLDYVRAESTSAIDISAGAAFPDLKTKRDTVVLYGDYLVSETLTIKARYQYENYDETNWSVDGIEPDTLGNVLSLGETSPDYSIGVFWLSLHYSF